MASDEIVKDNIRLDTVMMRGLLEYFHLQNAKHPRDNRKIRASTIGQCPRKIGFSVLGEEGDPHSTHMLVTFGIGHAVGDWATQWLIDKGYLDAEWYIDEDGKYQVRGNSEEEVEDERFKGHYDALTRPLKIVTDETGAKDYVPTTEDDPEGIRYLVDFKTMSDRVGFFWQDRNATSRPDLKIPKANPEGNPYLPIAGCLYPGNFSQLDGIPKDYLMQLSVYARIKGAGGLMLIVVGKDVEKKIAYKNPDDWRNIPIKVFTREGLCEDTLREIDEKADYIYSYTNKGEAPPIPEEYIDGMQRQIDKGKSPEKFFPCGCGCEFRFKCFPEHFEPKIGLREWRPHLFDNLETKES